ncbi:hypothetical protein [Nonomuraea sp. NPDC050202]|uniref:hypothetical protein n=1 Tax=Nonomuraea sp. NPDC050202 TaxID=3155035 RepID=UPI0033E2F751
MEAFRVDLHDIDNPDEPFVIEYFEADSEAAGGVAEGMLPELCERAGIVANPDDVYGLVWVNDGIGGAELFGTALLPDAYGGI